MPDERLSTDETEQLELHKELAAVKHDSGYRVVRLLKESAWERTELVEDDAGHSLVRKYLRSNEDFGRGWRAVAQLDDAHFPRVTDTYHLAEREVVITEYYDYPTLREYVEAHGPLSPDEARALTCDLCCALRVMHTLTPPLIHRDIKPDNILISGEKTMLLDFGIARTFRTGATRDTRIWGTNGYAPPEQLGFGQSDVRTDVYALGMVLLFMLTGNDPSPDAQRQLKQRTDIDKRAKQIISCCIGLNPTTRFASVDALATALNEPVPAKPPTPVENHADTVSGPKPQPTREIALPHLALQAKALARKLFPVWQVATTILYAFFAYCCLYSGATVEAHTSEVPRTLIFLVYATLALFVLGPLYVLACWMPRLSKRIPFIADHPVKSVLVLLGVTFLGALAVGILAGPAHLS